MNPEELLAYADFVHALARKLVLDPNSADDIAQQTWLAALEHPPMEVDSRTAWFSKVVRNFSRLLYRGEQRRRTREEKAASHDLSPSPEEISEKLETRRQLIDAVQDLEEPYRTAIVLRYYEDHPPREIAKRLGVPTETVRTRLKRGIERLRVRLDKAYGGDRKAWCLALAPLAGLKLKATAQAGSAAGTITGVSTLASGALIMSAKIKIGLAAAVILTSTIAFWQLLPEGDLNYENTTDFTETEANIVSMNVDSEEDGAISSNEKERIEPVLSAKNSQEHPGVNATGPLLAGRVIDKKTGEPVTVFQFNLLLNYQEEPKKVSIKETVRNASGEFSFPLEHIGEGRIQIKTARHRYKNVSIRIEDENGLTDLMIELDSGYLAHGQVVDHVTGEPVEDAIVRHIPELTSDNYVYRIRNGDEVCCNYARTDVNGLFRLSGLDEGNYNQLELQGKWKLVAIHPDYIEGVVITKACTKSKIEFRLHKGARIFGKALDDEGHPAPGIIISTVGEEMPIGRAVVTDKSGSFMTSPVPQGRIYLNAYPQEEVADSIDFIHERKWVDVKDKDVELNFGPSPQQVTWQGTFFDAMDQPVPNGTVTIRPISVTFAESLEYRMEIKVKCDDKGRFLFHKLLPGSYMVTLEGTFDHDWGKITFDSPGKVDRDLRITGGSIKGLVVNGKTGLPLTREQLSSRAYISTHIWNPLHRHFSANIDDQGGFQLFGLPAGSYRLSARITGFPYTLIEGVEVLEDKVTKDVIIKVYPGGKLKLKLTGFKTKEQQSFKMAIFPDGGESPRYKHDYYIGSNGEWEYERELEADTYKITLAFDQLGSVERTFEISEGNDTAVLIYKEEVVPHHGTIAVSGTFLHTDGTPVSGAHIHLYTSDAPGISKQERFKIGTTDSKGSFTIQGFKPGTWSVKAKLPGGGEPIFQNLVIPPAPANPYPLHLVLPAGEVTGTLADRTTGRRFTDQGPMWWAFLRDIQEKRTISELQGGHTGPRFTLAGVPAGTYQLTVVARGFKDYVMEEISIGKGRSKDVGEIRLEPCGVLNLTVADATGKKVDSYVLRCDGEIIPEYERFPTETEAYLYTQMPLGNLNLSINAEGFKTMEKKIELKPGEPLDLRVELQVEP